MWCMHTLVFFVLCGVWLFVVYMCKGSWMADTLLSYQPRSLVLFSRNQSQSQGKHHHLNVHRHHW